MPKRIEIGTDIAKIGLWDPTRERHDLGTAAFANYQSGLEAEAHAARLFFVNTGADGGYLTDIYVDEQPDPDRLGVYSALDREFLLESSSGRLIAGGIEDFVNEAKQITSDEDQIRVAPGFYALRFYQLIEDKFVERLRDHIGVEDYEYYENKSGRFPWGCLLFVIAIGCLFARLWYVSVGLFALWLIFLQFRTRLDAADHRLQDVKKRIEEFDDQYPPFIYVLRRVADGGEIRGGSHDLN